jgi:uncharacterized protein YbjT (DUF2867 family)
MTTVVVFGGTGFLGRRLVHRLASAGAIVHVAIRHPEGFPAVRIAPVQKALLAPIQLKRLPLLRSSARR